VSEFVFGTNNAAFVQVMYEQYLRDPASVSDDWRALFDNGKLAELPIIKTDRAEVLASTAPVAPPAAAPGAAPAQGMTAITGPAARLVQNMTDSLGVPTATSFRDVAVATLATRRRSLNAALASRNLKISFTHLIGWGIVQAVKQFPVMGRAFHEVDGKPHRFDPDGIHLGLAVDVERKDGSRALVVPVIKHAEAMDFAAFHTAYETLVEKARSNRLLPDDFAGATITLTNPGTIGTVASVPRLMKGQGSIIATGAIRDVAGAAVMTITSTYDHRVIQGAESGMFLRRLDALLQGADGFFDTIAESLGEPYDFELPYWAGEHPVEPAHVPVDRVLLHQAALAGLGDDRGDADVSRRRARRAADGPVRAGLLPDDVAEPVGRGHLARPRLGGPGVVQRERLQGLDHVAGVGVDQRIRAGDELGERGVREPLGERAGRVAREAPVEVLAVLGDHERAPGPERRQAEHGHRPDAAAQVPGLQAPGPAAHRRHRRVLAAVHARDDGQQRAVLAAGDLDHRNVEAGEVERAAGHRRSHVMSPSATARLAMGAAR